MPPPPPARGPARAAGHCRAHSVVTNGMPRFTGFRGRRRRVRCGRRQTWHTYSLSKTNGLSLT